MLIGRWGKIFRKPLFWNFFALGAFVVDWLSLLCHTIDGVRCLSTSIQFFLRAKVVFVALSNFRFLAILKILYLVETLQVFAIHQSSSQPAIKQPFEPVTKGKTNAN